MSDIKHHEPLRDDADATPIDFDAKIKALLANANDTLVRLPANTGAILMPRIEEKTILDLDDDQRVIFERHLGDGGLHFTDARTGGTFRVRDLMSGAMVMPCVSWLEDMIREGRVRVSRDAAGVVAGERGPQPDADYAWMVATDPQARKRRFVVLALMALKAKCSDPDIGRKLAQIWTPEVLDTWGEQPVAGTARRWLRKVLGSDEVRLVDMMDMTGRTPRKPSPLKMDPAMRQFVAEGARWFYTNRGYRIRDVQSRVDGFRRRENDRRQEASDREPQLKPVSRTTISRAVRDIRCRDTLIEKLGREWTDRHFKVSGEGLRTHKLLQIALIDDKELDGFFVLDGDRRVPLGKPWLCLIMDVHTRVVQGWHLYWGSPTIASAAVTFKNACAPKRVRPDRLARWPVLRSLYGLPGRLISDNGANYASPSFEDAMLDCGTTLQLAAVKTPTHKAILERFFFSLKTFLTEKLPGATLPPESMREMGLDAVGEAVVTLTSCARSSRSSSTSTTSPTTARSACPRPGRGSSPRPTMASPGSTAPSVSTRSSGRPSDAV